MANYLISIGGTGAKITEAVCHLAAAGIINNCDLHILFVDQDQANGNLDRTQALLETYIKCKNIGFNNQSNIYSVYITKSTQIAWAPIKELKSTLRKFSGYSMIPDNKIQFKGLYNTLFTRTELDTPLDEGFRGHPSIGAAAFFRRVDLQDEEPWRTFIEKIKTDTGGGQIAKILIAGSIFGGTGAAGVPTIARLIREKLERLGVERKLIRMSTILVLPYFTFMTSKNVDEETELVASADNFLIKAKVALKYYYNKEFYKIFDSLYLVGNDDPETIPIHKYSKGANQQRNDAHFVEILSGLAAKDFFNTHDDIVNDNKIKLVARRKVEEINWDDFPYSREFKKKIINFLRFGFIFLAQYLPIFSTKIKINPKRIPWLIGYFNGKIEDKDRQYLENIERYIKQYFFWLAQIHNFTKQKVNLVNWQDFCEKQQGELIIPEKLKLDFFDALVFDAKGYNDNKKIWHTLSNYKKERSLLSFLTSLYNVCSINIEEF